MANVTEKAGKNWDPEMALVDRWDGLGNFSQVNGQKEDVKGQGPNLACFCMVPVGKNDFNG